MDLKDIAKELGFDEELFKYIPDKDIPDLRKRCINRVRTTPPVTHKDIRDYIYVSCNTVYLKTISGYGKLDIYTDDRSVDGVKDALLLKPEWMMFMNWLNKWIYILT